MIHLLYEFIAAMVAVLGFSLMFNVGKRDLAVCASIGAIAWIFYRVSMDYYDSPVFGCLISAAMVGILSYMAARIFKNAATIYIIPGIIPMVPGINVFNTMVALSEGDTAKAADLGVEMLCMAGAIAVGLLIVESFTVFSRTLLRRNIITKDRY